MGFFDKVKNIFFEEDDSDEEDVKEERVARKIKNPEPEKREILEDLKVEEIKEEKEEKQEQFSVPFDDADFEIEKTIEFEEPIREEMVVENTEYREYKEYSEPIKIYGEEVIEDRSNRYKGLYEASAEEKKSRFTPSPIISPVFGILDKNYSKEEIVHKREVRLSQTSSKKADLDSVRERIESKKREKREVIVEEPGFYDLSEASPTIKEITLGDAEEYFTDLGLEYNVDYKVDDKKEEINKVEYKSRAEKNKDLSSDDDQHLFDLIDSIYEGKE